MIKERAFNSPDPSAILSFAASQADEIEQAASEFRANNPSWKPHTGKEIRDSKVKQGRQLTGYEYSILWVEHVGSILGRRDQVLTNKQLSKVEALAPDDDEQCRVISDLAYTAGLAYKLERAFFTARLSLVQAHCLTTYLTRCFDVARAQLVGKKEKPGDVLERVTPIMGELIDIVKTGSRNWLAVSLVSYVVGYPEYSFVPTGDKEALERLLAELYWVSAEYFKRAEVPVEDASRFIIGLTRRPLEQDENKLVPTHLYPSNRHILSALELIKKAKIEELDPNAINIHLYQLSLEDARPMIMGDINE